MGELTNAAADHLITYLLRTDQAITRPVDIYVGLATAAITDASTLATITEPTDTTYARQLAHDDDGNPAKFAAPANDGGVQKSKNNAAISFAFATGGTQVTYAFICNKATGSTGGLLIAYTQLDSAKTPSAGDTLEFATNALAFGIE